jgi:hypothetical protein
MCSASAKRVFGKALVDRNSTRKLSSRFELTPLSISVVTADSLPQLPVEGTTDPTGKYIQDLKELLGRIDSATTYYQILGVARSDGQERIKSSFHQLLDLLYPPYVIGRTLTPTITAHVERAFNKASQAFAVLASSTRRTEYDSALLSIATKPAVATRPQNVQPRTIKNPGGDRVDSSASVADANYDLNVGRAVRRTEAFRESASAKQGDNRRRCERFKLAIPARVTGYDRNSGKWHEMTQTIDVSRTGVRLRLSRRVKHGTVLFLTFPLPSKLRSHGFSEQSYNVYTLVRRIEPTKQGVRAVGVEFLGEHPPTGFLDKPWAIFRSNKWGGSERRRRHRAERRERVTLEYFDESMKSLGEETATTENESLDGLRISGTEAPPEFDLMRVTCPRLKFEGLAALRSRYIGKDGLERLCVQLVDKDWPTKS